jgi:membrane protease YdiL (CAAX protease family)
VSEGPDEDAPPDRDDPRGYPNWHPLARIFFYCGTLLLVSNLTVLIVIAVYLMFQEGGTTQERFEQLRASARADLLLGVYVLVAPVSFLWTAFFRRKIDRRDFLSVGFTRRGRARSLLTGIAIGMAAPATVVIPGVLLGVYEPGRSDPVAEASVAAGPLLQGSTALPVLLLLFLGFMMQSATEELALRGYVQRNMVEWKGAGRNLVWILIVPSLLFSLFHGFNPEFSAVAAVNTLLIGVLFGAVVLATGNLWSAIGLHGGWNFGLGCLWSLPVSGLATPRLFAIGLRDGSDTAGLFFGGDYGPEGGLIVTFLTLAGIMWALPRAMKRWLVDEWGTRAAEKEIS